MARNQETRQFTSETDGLQAWTIVAIALVLVAFSILAWVLSVQTPDVKIVDFSQMTGSSLKEVKMDSSLGSNRDQRGCLQALADVYDHGRIHVLVEPSIVVHSAGLMLVTALANQKQKQSKALYKQRQALTAFTVDVRMTAKQMIIFANVAPLHH
eukprot:TRINITY_DN23187_c1_g1_i2.p1 TRINITY_DN23187_c1_g1~~TRINITY_DN23187_c1_g1_i2.p1  ORF type:complete len:155 (-),score=18.42 TRINITY_DN23187_c1_g1_i2:212-676(-)